MKASHVEEGAQLHRGSSGLDDMNARGGFTAQYKGVVSLSLLNLENKSGLSTIKQTPLSPLRSCPQFKKRGMLAV